MCGQVEKGKTGNWHAHYAWAIIHGFSKGQKVLTKEFSNILPGVHFDVIKNAEEFCNTMSYCVKGDETRM